MIDKHDYAFATGDRNNGGQEGLSARDYIAVQAMNGLCVNAGRNSLKIEEPETIAKIAYEIADALIKQSQEE